MKSFTKVVFLLVAAMVAMVGAQDLSAFPTCAQWCINSMQQTNKSAELGCAAGDNGCLCRNPNFTYGVRDCSAQLCANGTTAELALGYANDFCRNNGVALTSVTTGGAAVTGTGAPTGSTTGTGAGAGAGGSGSAISTSEVVSTVTSGGSTFTTTSSSTIFATGTGTGASASPSETTVTSHSDILTTTTSNGSVIVSTVSSSSFTSTVTGGGAGSAGSGTSTRPSSSSSSSSTGFAPKMTAAPAAGVLAAAGVAALLF